MLGFTRLKDVPSAFYRMTRHDLNFGFGIFERVRKAYAFCCYLAQVINALWFSNSFMEHDFHVFNSEARPFSITQNVLSLHRKRV